MKKFVLYFHLFEFLMKLSSLIKSLLNSQLSQKLPKNLPSMQESNNSYIAANEISPWKQCGLKLCIKTLCIMYMLFKILESQIFVFCNKLSVFLRVTHITFYVVLAVFTQYIKCRERPTKIMLTLATQDPKFALNWVSNRLSVY